MLRIFVTMITLLVLSGANAQTPTRAGTGHDRAFWQAVVAQKYRVPESEAVLPLAMELAGFVSSTDAELRDTLGYEILANWIHRSGKLSAADLDALRKVFLTFALAGIGESGTDTIFTRSFALLNLKELAGADLKMPYLTQAAFDELFELALRSLASEKDLRGYVPDKGWAHATAHCADLLRALGHNSKLSVQQQSRLITAIISRTRATTTAFAWSEDARLAAALASVAQRVDAEVMPFDVWLAALRVEHRQLWDGAFDIPAYVRVRAQVNTLTYLAAITTTVPTFPAKLRDALNATLAKLN